MSVEAKICGLSTPETLDAAVRFGASFVMDFSARLTTAIRSLDVYPRSPVGLFFRQR